MVAILVLGAEAFVAVQTAAASDTTTMPLNFGKKVVSDGAELVDDHWK